MAPRDGWHSRSPRGHGTRLTALACDYTPGYDCCGAPDGVETIWRALCEDHSWSQLVFGKLPIDSPLVSRLPTLANAKGCPVVLHLE